MSLQLLLDAWFAELEDRSKVNVVFTGGSLLVRCATAAIAGDLHEALFTKELLLSVAGVKYYEIWFSHRNGANKISYGNTDTLERRFRERRIERMMIKQGQESIFAKQQQKWLTSRKREVIYIHSTEPGYKILYVQTPVCLQQLNRSDCLGKPLRHLCEELALPRERMFDSVLATLTNADEPYDFLDRDLLRLFKFPSCSAELTNVPGELLLRIQYSDPDFEYWENRNSVMQQVGVAAEVR